MQKERELKEKSLTIFHKNLQLLMKVRGEEEKAVDLADALDQSHQRVHHWVYGSCFPSPAMMIKICQHYKYFDIYRLLTVELNKSEID